MVSPGGAPGDGVANHQLGQILRRTCVDEVDITDPQTIDRALRVAVTNPAVLVEFGFSGSRYR
ncbi:hypothetical protein C5613_37715 [Rhodococcus opacus]|uniref:Uncharacterized protein n=1 Tax=Rhodococcus opacus TaxID=37919 RepID=A0A2S8IM91_RHOOP|nr:hypothetical protein C5613_37715 [Rhodococcus opacus]